MTKHTFSNARCLDYAAIRCKVTSQYRKTARFRKCVVNGTDDISVLDFGIGDIFAERFARYGWTIGI